MDGFLFCFAVAVASLASAAGAASGLWRVTGWSRAAAWSIAPVLLAPLWLGLGLWLGANLDNGDCDDICWTPAFVGFAFGAATAAVLLVIALLASLLWLSGRRGSSARTVQPM